MHAAGQQAAGRQRGQVADGQRAARRRWLGVGHVGYVGYLFLGGQRVHIVCWLCWLFVLDSQHSQQLATMDSYQIDFVGYVGYLSAKLNRWLRPVLYTVYYYSTT
jgi:hypothetical protein